jgi:hypothetical protein
VLSGGELSTVFIPDTEEVTGSIPVSPTSTKRASEQRKRRSEALCVSLCSDTVLAEWCTCVTSCVTMGNRFRGGRGLLASVGVRDCPLMSDDGTCPSSPRKGFGKASHRVIRVLSGSETRRGDAMPKTASIWPVRALPSTLSTAHGCRGAL